MTSDAQSRARGALLGLACGDAVGTTLEFKAPGTFEPITDMVGGGPFRLRAGQWTDDTSMALCLAESIIDVGELDLADNHRRYLAWWRQGYFSSTGSCFDIGGTTSSQLRRFERTGDPLDPTPDEESAANGSLMRLAPVPIAWHRDVAGAAERSGESSRSTHAATRPVDACRLMGAMVAALIGGTSAEEVFAPDFWRWGDLHPQIAAITAGSYRHREPPEIRGTGFCVDALEAALWAVHGAVDFAEAVLRAANLGNDADTTAAIAGQLAGARWGVDAIPVDWLMKLTDASRIESLADALCALHAVGPREESWRQDDEIHGWWVAPGKLLATEYPGTLAGHDAKVDVLLDGGVRSFVDLTTPADHLTPYRDLLLERAAFRGLDVRHHSRPIPDMSTIDAAGYREILRLIDSELAAGRTVAVHCWGGIGRTGTVVGCWLVEHGVHRDKVLAHIADLRATTRKAQRSCPETAEQRRIVETWSQ